jgi:tRNA threonylcarbamoyladenosine biosynthesis protein TsaB
MSMTFTGCLLAVENSGPRGSVVLLNGHELRAAGELPSERAGGLLPLVRDVLAEGGCRAADLAAYCFSRGPGSFTGLRTAATLGRVLGVPTLEAIASNASGDPVRPEQIVAMIDARRGQVYAAAYRPRADGTLVELVPAGVHDPEALLSSLQPPLAVLGAGVAACRTVCEARGAQILDKALWNPTAAQVARIALRRLEAGEVPAEADSLPLYLRPPECEEVYEQRRAEARRRREKKEQTPLSAAEYTEPRP